ncbi:MAG: DUF1641 domain-containing protein [Actinomycetia bacterium]|nr:DUF1641 domain-containing protein [Actinomycetes bacterium]
MTTSAPAPAGELEAKIDALTAQVAFLTEEATQAKMRRESWTELSNDAMPIAGDLLGVLERELGELSADVEITDITQLARRLVRVAPVLDRALGYLEMFSELAGDMWPLTEQMVDSATDRLVEVDAKGYFTFAKGGLRVVDEVVTNFSDEDVEALGDNVVLILNTVKELTQPEIMAVLYRMIGAVQRQQAQLELESAEAPSLFHLMKRMRDPEIRKGLGRALNTLSVVSEVDPTPSAAMRGTSETNQPEAESN